MPLHPHAFGSALATALGLAALLAGPAPARGDAAAAGVRVTRVEGPVTKGAALTALTPDWAVLAGEPSEIQVPLADVISIDFGRAPDGPREREPGEVAVDLWQGDRIVGTLLGGDDDGVTLRSSLLGDVRVPLDAIAALDVLARVEGGVERPPQATGETDVVHLVGGDRVDCTIVSLTAGFVVCATEASDTLRLPLARVIAVRLAKLDSAKPTGRLFTVALRDGSRVVGPAPTLTEGRVLTLRGAAGYDARARLDDVVAMLVRGERYAYVSDLPAPRVEVVPFWKPVAGDPTRLYAPRFDRSFGDGPLTVAGRTWLKGVGVYAGTTLTWPLDEAFSEFRAAVGVDDAAGPLGGVVFQVLVDGNVRWSSGFVRAAELSDGRGDPGPVDAGRIDLTGAKSLGLRVLAGDDKDPYPIQDHADWLGALLVRK